MAIYSFKIKLKIVQEYLKGKGQASYLSMKHEESKKYRYKMDKCLSRIR
ncbi:hypothetical protein IGI52_001529 [Enterococcus sp. DIV0187]